MKTNFRNLRRNALALAVTAALSSGVVYAQDQEKPVEEDKLSEVTLIVTAQKRNQYAQEVGIAISAISGDDMRIKGIDDLGGIVESLSNVELQDITGGGMPVMIVRGVGLQDIRVNNTPTTPFYIDEVYQASIAQTAFTMFDVERVEILKGPQGGLYGRNATGGAVQVISQKPELGDSNGYASLGLGKWDRVDFEAAYGTELSDTVAMRIAGKQVTSGDTYTYSVSENTNHGEADAWGGRLMFLISPNDNWDILIKAHGGEDNSETDLLRAAAVFAGNTPSGRPGASFDALLVNTCATPGAASCYTMDGRTHAQQGVDGNVHATTSSTLPRLNNKWSGFSARVDWTNDDYTFTSISALDEMDHGRNTDFDGHEFESQHVLYNSRLRSKSQEFRLSHDSDDYSWIVGANYAEDSLIENTQLLGAEGPLPFAGGFGLTMLDQPYDQNAQSSSVYGHLDYSLNDDVNLVTELRYTDETLSMNGGTAAPEFGGFFLASIDDKKSFNEVSGKIGANWKVSDDAMLYTNLSRGFKSGGYPGGITDNPASLLPYDQEVVHAFEIGAKSDLLNNTLRLNGAVFYYDYQDQQGIAQVVSPLTNSIVKKLTNLGDTRVTGAELDITWLPADGWFIQTSLGITDAEVADSTLTTKDTFLSSSDPLSDVAVEGARLPNVADWSLNTTIRYEHNLTSNLLGMAQLEYSYRDDMDLTMAISAKEIAFYNEDAYGLANLRYSIVDANNTWILTGYVLNVTDEAYRSAARPDGLTGFYEMYGAPRSYGVTYTYNW